MYQITKVKGFDGKYSTRVDVKATYVDEDDTTQEVDWQWVSIGQNEQEDADDSVRDQISDNRDILSAVLDNL